MRTLATAAIIKQSDKYQQDNNNNGIYYCETVALLVLF